MMTEASEEQIAALRERVEGRSERGSLLAALCGGACAWLLTLLLTRVPPDLAALFLGLWLVSFSILARLFDAILHRRLLRRQLAAFPAPQQLALLADLEAGGGLATRYLVAPLIRELRIGTELAPADAPTGRGDEPTP
jgi:hypothetical protein